MYEPKHEGLRREDEASRESDAMPGEIQGKTEGKVDFDEWLNSNRSGNENASKSQSRGGDLDRSSDHFGGDMLGK